MPIPYLDIVCILSGSGKKNDLLACASRLSVEKIGRFITGKITDLGCFVLSY